MLFAFSFTYWKYYVYLYILVNMTCYSLEEFSICREMISIPIFGENMQ